MQQTKLWTALITPFDNNGKIDYGSLENLILKQQQANNGILILGSTGEALALSLTEKKQIIKLIAKLNLSIPVMVGVGGFRLPDQIEWVEFCQQQQNISSFLLVTPLYAKPNVKGQTMWFQALLDKSKLPCMLYNIPSRTGVELHPQVLTALKDHPNLWALKEAGGNINDYQKYSAAASKLEIFCGNDDQITDYLALGAKGLVSVMANVWPQVTKEYITKTNGKNISTLAWQKACKKLFVVTNPIPTKAMLYKKGWIKSPYLRLPLTHEDMSDE